MSILLFFIYFVCCLLQVGSNNNTLSRFDADIERAYLNILVVSDCFVMTKLNFSSTKTTGTIEFLHVFWQAPLTVVQSAS